MIDLKRIKSLCNEAGITIKKLSDKTKISQTAITMAMHRNSTTLETLEKIAHFFGISVGYFFGEEDSFKPIRESFEKFDNDLHLAGNFFKTTMQYYVPNLEYPIGMDAFFKKMQESYSDEVISMLDFSYSKLLDNPVCAYLQQFNYEELALLFKNGVITKEVIEFIVTVKNKEFFEDDNNLHLFGIAEKTEPNYWEKLLHGIKSHQKK